MTPEQIRGARLYVGAFVACVVLTILSIAFVDRAVSSWSHATLRQTEPFVWLTHIIDPFVPAASIGLLGAAIAAVFGWRPGPVGRTIVALCIAVLIATIFKDELKYLFGRTWPETWVGNNPSWIHDRIYRFEPLHGGKGWTSFPSGHMATIAAPCTVLWMLAPRVWRWLWASLILGLGVRCWRGYPDARNCYSASSAGTRSSVIADTSSVGPKIASNSRLSAASTSGILTGRPRSTSDVTPRCAALTPHGTMPAKCERSGSTLSAMPWNVTQRRTRMPTAAILSSAPCPKSPRGLSGRSTQTPTRSSRRSPRTLKPASVAIIQASSAATKAR